MYRLWTSCSGNAGPLLAVVGLMSLARQSLRGISLGAARCKSHVRVCRVGGDLGGRLLGSFGGAHSQRGGGSVGQVREGLWDKRGRRKEGV